MPEIEQPLEDTQHYLDWMKTVRQAAEDCCITVQRTTFDPRTKAAVLVFDSATESARDLVEFRLRIVID